MSLRRLKQVAQLVSTCFLGGVGLAVAQKPYLAPAAPPTPNLQVAFTFDDLPAHAPKPGTTSRYAIAQSVLDTLKRENLPPVFGFVNGQKVERQPKWIHILEDWRAAGEPLGSHTWSHPEFDKLTAAQYEADILKNEPLLKQVDPNGDWHWFRFPYLEEGDTLPKREAVRGWLADHGYRIAEVTIDFEDYLWNDPYARCMNKHNEAGIAWLHKTYLEAADQDISVYRTLSQEVYGRDIKYVLLLHLGAFDARMLPELIALFRARGFSFISLPDAESDPAYAVDPAVPAPGGGLLEELMASKGKYGFPPNEKPEKQLDRLCR